MSDAANTPRAVSLRVHAMFTGGDVRWWAVKDRLGWSVVSRMVDNVPIETRQGERYTMVVGPYVSRRRAQAVLERHRPTREQVLAVLRTVWDYAIPHGDGMLWQVGCSQCGRRIVDDAQAVRFGLDGHSSHDVCSAECALARHQELTEE